MSLVAITHTVSPRLAECELTHLDRIPIDIANAEKQHSAYCDMLRRLDIEVIEISDNADYPDSVFVEDTAIVVDEIAVMTRPGALSRRGEIVAMEPVLAKYRKIARIIDPGTLDGGDVLQMGKHIYVGLSSRTNLNAIDQLSQLLTPFGYLVTAVPVQGSLHLKSAVGALDDKTILVARDWFDPAPMANHFKIIDVAPKEPGAANVLTVNKTVIIAAAFPHTAGSLRELGYNVISLDISELQKAESGLTCSSIIFNHIT